MKSTVHIQENVSWIGELKYIHFCFSLHFSVHVKINEDSITLVSTMICGWFSAFTNCICATVNDSHWETLNPTEMWLLMLYSPLSNKSLSFLLNGIFIHILVIALKFIFFLSSHVFDLCWSCVHMQMDMWC